MADRQRSIGDLRASNYSLAYLSHSVPTRIISLCASIRTRGTEQAASRIGAGYCTSQSLPVDELARSMRKSLLKKGPVHVGVTRSGARR
jgi:hypothetical protein